MQLKRLALPVVLFLSVALRLAPSATAQDRDPNRTDPNQPDPNRPRTTTPNGDVAPTTSMALVPVPTPTVVPQDRYEFVNPDTAGHHRLQLSLGYAFDSVHAEHDHFDPNGLLHRNNQESTTARTAIKFEYGYFATDQIDVAFSVLADGNYRGADRGNAIDFMFAPKFFLFHLDHHNDRENVERDTPHDGQRAPDADGRRDDGRRDDRVDHREVHREMRLDDWIQPYFGPQIGISLRSYRETVLNTANQLDTKVPTYAFLGVGGVVGIDFILTERVSLMAEYNFVVADHGGRGDVRSTVLVGCNFYFY